ncbi:MAG: CRTAC1 family protein [Planctomycetota bacterium]
MSRLAMLAVAIVAIAGGAHAQITFTDVTTTSGIAIPPYVLTAQAAQGRGCAWADYDGDGDQDVFVAGGAGRDYEIWWNQGTGGFVKQVVLADPGNGHQDHQVVAADFDNDGDSDVYVAVGYFLPNLLFVNQGGGIFVEDAAARGVALAQDSLAASFGDVDRDGWLDLYVANYIDATGGPAANVFYRNNGNGTFTDLTIAAGAAAPGYANAAFIHDFDEDGGPDIIVGNDKGMAGPSSTILRNLRIGGFADVGASWNANPTIESMGITVGDIDNDGGWDIFMTDVPTDHCLMLWNEATGIYASQPTWHSEGMNYGLSGIGKGWSCFFADFDLDRQLDLFYTLTGAAGRFYSNSGGAPFLDISAACGIQTLCPPTLSSSLVDYDSDGDLDIFLPGDMVPARLLRNDQVTGFNWLGVDLVGTNSNRDAIGALVICRLNGTELRRARISGEGYLSDGDKRLFFGLKGSTQVQEIEIRWPSGTVQYLANVPSNQFITVVEPAYQVTGTMVPGSANVVSITLPDDALIPYVHGITANVFTQYDFPDGRSILTDVNDPLLVLSTIPGNSAYANSLGFYDALGKATMTLNLPPIPSLTGVSAWFIGASWHPSYGSNVKSIVGPQAFTIQ